jgi:hypothetical protein
MALPIPTLVERARRELSQVTSLKPSSTLGVSRGDGSWRVLVEMIEKKSLPDGMDVLATYEVLLDEDGNMLEFSRKKLRRRMDTDVEE